MAVNILPSLKLKERQSNQALLMESRSAETYNRTFLIEGNSLVSTVYIKSMDVGASLTVNYWEYTTGSDTGERREIKSHPVFTDTSLSPHLLIVSPFHNGPQLEAIVTGGNVEFSVYVTCVSSFASAQDASLILDGDTFDPANNLAQPMACLDESTNQLFFLRCRNGVFPADPIYLGDAFRISGSTTLTAGSTETLTSFTVAVGTLRRLSRIIVNSFHPGYWSFEIGGSVAASGRIAAGDYESVFDYVPREEVAAGTLCELKYNSRSGQSGSDIDWHILGSDET